MNSGSESSEQRDTKHHGRLSASGVFSGLRVVVSSTILSRMLGMVRDIATARLFGTSLVMDAFAFAFRIPNLARRLFGEGALSAAFLPVFSRVWERSRGGDQVSAWQLATAVFTLLTVVLSGLVLVGEAGLWLWSRFGSVDEQSRLLLGLTAVMLPYLVLICLAAQVTAVLHALGHFTIPALVPVVLNLCWIGSIFFVDPLFEPNRVQQAYALAVCLLAAGVLQLGLQWPTLVRLGYRVRLNWQQSWPGVREILVSMLPVTLGLSIMQLNTLLDSGIAWMFSNAAGYPLRMGTVSVLYYSERGYQFPLGVFGVALGTVLFPLFARHAARGEIDHLRDDLSLALRLVLVIGIPASVGMVLVAEPFTDLLFRGGDFTDDDVQRTSRMLVGYGLGVWAYCGVPVLYRAFYALGERVAPLRVGLAASLLDMVIKLVLIWPLGELAFAFSTAFTSVVHVAGLTWLLQARVGRVEWSRLASTAWRTVIAAAVMSAVCYYTLGLFGDAATLTSRLLRLIVPLVISVVTYFVAAWLLGVEEMWLLVSRDHSTDLSPPYEGGAGGVTSESGDSTPES
jgi:putative peptidoglycan lipid II flippase